MDFHCVVKLENGKLCGDLCAKRITLTAGGLAVSVPICTKHKALMDANAKKPDLSTPEGIKEFLLKNRK